MARVVKYIDDKAKDKMLTSEVMLLLHKMLLSNIRDDIAGRFRKEAEWVKVGNHIAVDPKLVIEESSKMFITYQSNPEKSIIERIARFHLTFENIHPFVDGKWTNWKSFK